MRFAFAFRLSWWLLAVSTALPASGLTAQELRTVRYQEYPGSMVHLSNWVMREKGFCTKHGLRCDVVLLANGPLAQQAVAADSVDIIMSSIDVMMQAVAKGNDLQILGAIGDRSPYSLSVSSKLQRPNAKLGYPGNMKDLVGKRIGVSGRGSATELTARSLLEGAGHSPSDATYIGVGAAPTAYAALMADQVDAILSWDPVPTLCEVSKKCEVMVDLRKGEGPPLLTALNRGFSVWQARRKYVENNGPTIDAFLKANIDAIEWLRDEKNFPEAMKIAAAHFKLGDVPDREHALKLITRESIDQYGTTVDRRVINAFNEFLIHFKVLDKPLDAGSLIYKNAP